LGAAIPVEGGKTKYVESIREEEAEFSVDIKRENDRLK
jgi:hypothetical protein